MPWRALTLADAGLAHAAPDIAPLQLGTRHAQEEKPPLVFLHKAWRRIAEALEKPAQTPVAPTQPAWGPKQAPNGPFQPPPPSAHVAADQSSADEPSLAFGDQPFDMSRAPLLPDTLPKLLEMQEAFEKGWTETFHFIHRLTVRSWLAKIYNNMNANVSVEVEIGYAKAAIAMMTLALGSLFYVKPRNPGAMDPRWDWVWTRETADQLFLAARRLTDVEPGPPTLESVQARLLQVLYLMCTCRLHQAWFVFGNVIQLSTSLGLHRRRGRNNGLGIEIVLYPEYAKIECEKRTFWSAYVLDRQLALMTGRPCLLNSDAVDQEMPDCVNDEDMGRGGPFRKHQGDCYVEALVERIK